MFSIQAKVMEILQQELGEGTSLVKWLSSTLSLEYSAAYRKAHCSSHLKLNELAIIYRECPKVHRVWPNEDQQGRVLVKQHSFANYQDVETYLQQVKSQLERALQYKMTLQYFARDFPLFLFLAEPVLLEYKMSMWTHQLPENGLTKLSAEAQALAGEVYQLYCLLPSEEIWFARAMQNQMDQLQWHHSIAVIDDGQLQAIKAAFERALSRFHQFALKGSKREDGHANYQLFSSGFCTLNNGGIFKKEGHSELSLALMSVFFITSEQRELVAVFEREYAAHLKSALHLQNQKWAAAFFEEQKKILA